MKPVIQLQTSEADGADAEISLACVQRASEQLEFSYLLAEATRLMRAAFDARMRSIGLTGATARALVFLSRQNGLSQIELARRLDVSRMALGQTVDRLEKSGHVERRPDPGDRRVWRLYLTPLAANLMSTIANMATEQQHQFLENISTEEVEALKSSLRKVTERLRAMPLGTLVDDEPTADRGDPS